MPNPQSSPESNITDVIATPEFVYVGVASDSSWLLLWQGRRITFTAISIMQLFPLESFFAGKPPISRNPSSVTPKKRLPFHKKPTKGTDTLSVKSAPSSAQKSGGLSTTIVSHVTTSSANSAPLHDPDPSHYRDFADDINNQVRQNKLVRSSAIHDVRRF